MMLKDLEKSRESARVKAERKWTNTELVNELRQEKAIPKRRDPNAPPKVTDVVKNEGKLDGRVKRFENKFKKHMRTMMEAQKEFNLKIYAVRLEHRRRILLREKLRRLKLAQPGNGE
jgi:hypothetical protein